MVARTCVEVSPAETNHSATSPKLWTAILFSTHTSTCSYVHYQARNIVTITSVQSVASRHHVVIARACMTTISRHLLDVKRKSDVVPDDIEEITADGSCHV